MEYTFSFPLSYGVSKIGLPLIPVVVGGYALCFIIDTGATLSLIDSGVVGRLGGLALRNNNNNSLLGIDGLCKESSEIAVLRFKINHTPFIHTFVCESLFHAFIQFEIECDMQIHGILGNDFLLKNKWIIDFKRLEIYTH